MAHPADEQIRVAIVVVVAPRRADGRKDAAHTRLAGDVGEGTVSVVVKQAIGNVPVEDASGVIGDEQVEISVAVVVDPGRRKTRPPCLETRLRRDIGESAVAVVVKQSAVTGVPAEASYVEIDE